MDETMNVAAEFHAMPGLEKERECSKDPKGSYKLYTSSYAYPMEVVGAYSVELRKLSCNILELISEGLGLRIG
ncbi:hypothetical protein CRYUN_Cryun20dG0083600 [Craigia yunnanensis]